MKAGWFGLAFAILLGTAAGPAAAREADDGALGVVYSRHDSLAVWQPALVLTFDLKPERLFLDINLLGFLAPVTRPAGGAETRLTGNIVPVAAAGLWYLGAAAVLGEDSAALRVAKAPAMVLGASILQPRVRWHPVRAAGLEAGWGGDWLLFHDEAGYAWRPAVGVAIRPVGTLVLEAGVQRDLWWSFEGRSGDWGWGWYAGARVWPEMR